MRAARSSRENDAASGAGEIGDTDFDAAIVAGEGHDDRPELRAVAASGAAPQASSNVAD